MEFELLGWPGDGPTLSLDHRRFSYAGKFVMSSTGKAVARDPAEAAGSGEAAGNGDAAGTDDADGSGEAAAIVAAVAFNADRTDPDTCWLRYVTVREDRRGEGIAPRLVRFVCERIAERGSDQVRIAVNNPFAFHALSRAGFAYVGEETGIAELVMAWPGERARASYQAGLDVFRERDLSDDEEAFLFEKRDADPPAVVDAP